MTSAADGTQDILDFWFGEIGPRRWWEGRSRDVDDAIRTRFLGLWEEWRGRAADQFLATAGKALAAIILFDQFPRNMFRGDARAFSTDALALEIAIGAIDKGYEARLTEDERSFLYMPFQHSEDLAMQDRAVALFTALGKPDSNTPKRIATSSRATAASPHATPRSAAKPCPRKPRQSPPPRVGEPPLGARREAAKGVSPSPSS